MGELPSIRPDIVIYEGGADFNGTPTWVLHDPLSNQFYQIGYVQFKILSAWQLNTPFKVIQTVNTSSTIEISIKHIKQVEAFLSQHNLLAHQEAVLSKKANTNDKRLKNPLTWLMSKAIFIKIPLCNPDRFLTRTIKHVGWLFHRYTVFAAIALTLIILAILSRQWELFTSTFVDTFSINGMILFGSTFIISKLIHELGHAYQCKHQGLKVPAIGIAWFIILPLFYTDTAESWRIKDNRKRMLVGISGMWFELYLAILASMLWLSLPEGILKSAMFYFATTNWLLTLVINITPFLRLDGYHILSDYLGIRNLQTRTFAIARVWVRRTLFGIQQHLPEPISKKAYTWFILYAIGCWAYRFILFITIATIVYEFVFKLLGMLLVILQLYLFIARPIITEIKYWWSIREKVKSSKRAPITLSALVLMIILLFIPFERSQNMPATASYNAQELFLPYGAQLKSIHVTSAQQVKAGQTLMTFNSSYLKNQIQQAKTELKYATWQLKQSYYHKEKRLNHHVYLQQQQSASAKLSSLESLNNKLIIKAPFTGIAIDINPSLQAQDWSKQNTLLLKVAMTNTIKIEAMVGSNTLKQLKAGQSAIFYPNELELKPIPALITNIDTQAIEHLSATHSKSLTGVLSPEIKVKPAAMHAQIFGGSMRTRQSTDSKLIPTEATYRITLTAKQPYPISHVAIGEVQFHTVPRSVAVRLWHAFILSSISLTAF